MPNITFKIWDDSEKQFVCDDSTGFDVCCPTLEKAEEIKFFLLDRGNYPDRPHAVYQILKYERNKCLGVVL